MTFLPEKVLPSKIRVAFEEKAGFSLTDSLQYACYVGSQSHNTYVPKDNPDSTDDIYILAIVLPPPRAILGL